MNSMNRRQVIVLLGGTTLAGCAGASGQIPLYVAALRAVGQQALLSLPQLKTAGLSGPTADTIAKALTEISTVGQAISDAASATDGQSTLIKIEGYINAIAPLAVPFAALVPGGALIGLVVAALPAIEFAVNLTVSLLTPPAKVLASTAPKPAGAARGVIAVLTPEQALAELLRRSGR
jgi:predicted small secreted protein